MSDTNAFTAPDRNLRAIASADRTPTSIVLIVLTFAGCFVLTALVDCFVEGRAIRFLQTASRPGNPSPAQARVDDAAGIAAPRDDARCTLTAQMRFNALTSRAERNKSG
jgi:hypothetical protein